MARAPRVAVTKPAAASAPETGKGGLPILPFESAAAFEGWLRANHANTDGIWIKFAKKGSGIPTVVYREALDSALCHGWIDGQAQSIDDDWYLQKFTPRRARSNWSAINVGKVAKLIEEGRMQPAGLAEIERAKADGRWERASPSPKQAAVPPDLQAAFDADPKAEAAFKTLNSQNRYAILYRLHSARRPETRAKRIAEFVAMLGRGETIY